MTIYFDSFVGPIPCQFIGWAKTPAFETTARFNAVIKLKRSSGLYKAGEVMHLPSWAIVEKVKTKCVPVKLPPVDPDNLIPSRW